MLGRGPQSLPQAQVGEQVGVGPHRAGPARHLPGRGHRLARPGPAGVTRLCDYQNNMACVYVVGWCCIVLVIWLGNDPTQACQFTILPLEKVIIGYVANL